MTYDPTRANLDSISRSVEDIGYEFMPVTAARSADDGRVDERGGLRRVVVSWPLGIAVLLLLAFDMDSEWARWAAALLTVPIQFWAGWPFLRTATLRARHFEANMDTLIALGTLAAFTLSVVRLFTGGDLYFDTAALIIGSSCSADTSRPAWSAALHRLSVRCWSSARRKPASWLMAKSG